MDFERDRSETLPKSGLTVSQHSVVSLSKSIYKEYHVI